MNLYKPSQLHQRLQELGVHAKKGLGQNFLIDGNIIRKIIATSRVQPGDFVIEIGSGPGALTEALLSSGAEVLAIEKDTVFANALTSLQTEDERLEVVQADVLEIPLPPLLEGRTKKAKIIANLPYNITTPILSRFIPLHASISSMTIMVQKEVAERMTAKKGTSEYSSLTVFLQFFAEASYAFTVSPNCFFPRPKVHSAVVNLEIRPPKAKVDEEAFFQFTRGAFQMRRKMMRVSLKEKYTPEQIEKAFASTGIKPESRPEELSLDDFLRLFDCLSLS
jgi:16S rRNA (adenine1518-N6/adenine1519-N6)-dimethyltransferase